MGFEIRAAGLHPGSVMPPTMTRMAYLTLRGLAAARMIETIEPRTPRIVEVHPAAALALRGGPIEHAREFKKDASSRAAIFEFLQEKGLHNIGKDGTACDHLVAACAGALAAWKWARGRTVWIAPAEPPHHPYDFAC